MRPATRSRRTDRGPAHGGGWRWGVFLMLSAFLLFAHGCHGDEDNELFALARQLVSAAR